MQVVVEELKRSLARSLTRALGLHELARAFSSPPELHPRL